jgi:hypothetical protein
MDAVAAGWAPASSGGVLASFLLLMMILLLLFLQKQSLQVGVCAVADRCGVRCWAGLVFETPQMSNRGDNGGKATSFYVFSAVSGGKCLQVGSRECPDLRYGVHHFSSTRVVDSSHIPRVCWRHPYPVHTLAPFNSLLLILFRLRCYIPGIDSLPMGFSGSPRSGIVFVAAARTKGSKSGLRGNFQIAKNMFYIFVVLFF